MYRNATYTYPASVTVNGVGLNAFTPAGTLDQGFAVIPVPDRSAGFAHPADRGRRDVVSSQLHPRQDQRLEHHGAAADRGEHERSALLRREPSREDDAVEQHQLRPDWRRRGQPAVLPVDRHECEHQHPRSARQGPLRRGPAARVQAPGRRILVHRGLHLREGHRRLGHGHPAPRVSLPQPGRLRAR